MDSPYWKGPLPGVDVQRRYLWKTFRGKPNSIPGSARKCSASARSPVRLHPGMLFGFSPESCSTCPGMLFGLPRNTHGGVNVRLKCSAVKARLRDVLSWNGPAKAPALGVSHGRRSSRLQREPRVILCSNIFAVFNGRMTTEQSENEKRPATPRSEAMRKAWEKRRASAALEAESLAQPVCCCGCRARLEVAKNQEHQRYFKPGHDSALKSLLRKINRGEAKREDIPQAARANV